MCAAPASLSRRRSAAVAVALEKEEPRSLSLEPEQEPQLDDEDCEVRQWEKSAESAQAGFEPIEQDVVSSQEEGPTMANKPPIGGNGNEPPKIIVPEDALDFESLVARSGARRRHR